MKINLEFFQEKLDQENLTKKEFAALAGIAYKTVYNIFNGKEPLPKTVRKICDYFDVPIEELVEEDDNVREV